jgi:citrate synthase
MTDPTAAEVAGWWHTSITDIEPGVIRVRGYAIEELIGNVSFPEMIWLMLRGELPSPAKADLFGAALVAAVDHGPHAPSIAIARMAVTCGVGINNAVASGVNALGDVHGGAGQQAMELYLAVAEGAHGVSVDVAADVHVGERLAEGRPVGGFGHRFHAVDPRAGRLLTLVDAAVARGIVDGVYARIGRAVEVALARHVGRPLPMNIDGVTAVVYAELGFPPELARGLFVLSRSVGIVAHSWEQSQQGGRIKGPVPKSSSYAYEGPSPRLLEVRS